MDNNAQNNRTKVVSGLTWIFMARFGAQIVTFVVSLILARLLDPVVFGTVAILTVFMEIMTVFVDSGLGNALIQKKNADNLDFSTVFYFNIAVGVITYFIMFFAAPIIADFYAKPELVSLVRVLSLSLVISGIKNVQDAYVAKNLLFNKSFYASIGGTVGSAILGIWMAYNGFGAWALVGQNLFANFVNTVILWFVVKWRPDFAFSFSRFKGLFTFGWKLLVSSIINTIYNNLRQLVIGKLYSAKSLAFYNRGYMIPNTVVCNINTAIDTALFPAMSSAQDDVATVKAMTRRSIRISSYIMWPMMMGIAACATPLVSVLLSDAWLPSVPYLVVFSIYYAMLPLQTANLNAIKALGKSGVYLKLEIIKKTIGFVILFATMWFGPFVMALSMLLFALLSFIVNAAPNRKLLDYTYKQQVADMLPSMLLSCAMAAPVYCVQLLGLENWLTLLIQIPFGVALYVLGSKLFRVESFDYLLVAIKELLHKKKNH